MQTLCAHNGGIQFAYQRFGSTGDPLLLVIGIGADMLYWHDQLCIALTRKRFQVARFDNRDSGESTHLRGAGTPKTRRVRRHPDAAPYRLDRRCSDVDAPSWVVGLLGVRRAWKIFKAALTWGGRGSN